MTLCENGMEGSSYRKEILEGLEERDRRLKTVRTLFKNYSMLAEQVSRSRRRSRVAPPAEDSSTEIVQLREEMANVYKMKSKNDQDLIEANRRLVDAEAKLATITSEVEQLRAEREKLSRKVATMEVEMSQVRNDLSTTNDERVALTTTCNMLSKRKMELENEREQLLNKIRELNERHADFMNAELALDEQRKQLKIREEIVKATQDTSRDERVNSALTRVSPDTSGDDLLGDTVPNALGSHWVCDEGEVHDALWTDDDCFATAGGDAKVRLWRVSGHSEFTKISSLAGCIGTIYRLAFDSERRSILAASADKTVRMWHVDTQRLIATFSGHTEKVTSARFHLGHQIVSGGYDRTVKIWDSSSQRCSRSFFPGSTVLDLVSLSASGNSAFVTGHYDKKVRFWDGRQSEAARTVEMSQKVTSLDSSLDGQQILVATRDDTLSILDVRNLSVIHMYSAEQYKTTSDMSRAIFSPGGEFVAAGASHGAVFIWNTRTTRLEKMLRGGHDTSVLSLSWNPTGRGLVSVDRQKTVAYWK